jgi:ketosteroid isomerase-like protein
VQPAAVRQWTERYERAWRSPGTDALADLFAPEATYQTAPFERPHLGIAAIAEMWEAERQGPDEAFAMTSELVAADGLTAVVRVEVRYRAPIEHRYRDIWIVRFNDAGLCTSFEEWPFWPADEDGGFARPPTA